MTNSGFSSKAPLCYVGPLGTSCLARNQQRVVITPRTNERLRRYVSKKMHGRESATRLGSIVLDTYLTHMERVYYGRGNVRCCSKLEADSRDKDAVIFDMDGVVCDSEAASRNVGVRVFEKMYQTQVKAEDFAAFTGTGEGNFLNGVAQLYNVKDFDVELAKKKFFELYMFGELTMDIKAFVGVPKLIQRIHDLGLKTGVASAADKVKVDANLSAVGLKGDKHFDFVTSSEDIANKKPAPDVFLAAAKGLQVEPSRCTVIEDAAAGVIAAKAAGMRCIAVATSLPEEELREAGADVIRKEPAFIEVADLFDDDVFYE